MPLPKGTKFRVKTTRAGVKVRLAFNKGQVIEAKNLETGKVHTPAEFARDRMVARINKRNANRKKTTA